ncbi:MAG TPA: hypothetical protein VNI58_10275 [Mariprofundaceae bacterium]|nr:hypothetical protein [Mariprofundaceae bacterium]
MAAISSLCDCRNIAQPGDVRRCHMLFSGMDNRTRRSMIRRLMNRMHIETVSKWRWLLATAAVSYCLVSNDQ